VQEFGFREFWIEGRKFFLNNTEIRLRPLTLGSSTPPAKLLQPPLDTPTSAKSGPMIVAVAAPAWRRMTP
jgi:hypothetical protein